MDERNSGSNQQREFEHDLSDPKLDRFVFVDVFAQLLAGPSPPRCRENQCVQFVCHIDRSVGRFRAIDEFQIRKQTTDTKHTYRTPKAQQQKQEKQTTSTNHNYVRTLAVFKSR